jgi:regulator of cell morphogenesis and NO signaling
MRTDERTLAPEMTIVETLRQLPHSITVFDELGIDYACRGATLLRNAAAPVGLTAAELMSMIELAPRNAARDWNAESLSTLTRFLTKDHEVLTGKLLTRVRTYIETAIEAFGSLPLLRRLRELELTLADSLEVHARSEEEELFPLVGHLEEAEAGRARPPATRISPRVLLELIEHESFRDRVHALRDHVSTVLHEHDVTALSRHVDTFERHLHRHMHLENNVLYPRAIAIENALRHRADAS